MTRTEIPLGTGTYYSTQNENGSVDIKFVAGAGNPVPSFTYNAPLSKMRNGDETLPSTELLYSFLQWQAVKEAFNELELKDAKVDVMYFHSTDEEMSENFAFVENPSEVSNSSQNSVGHADEYNRNLGQLDESNYELKLY